MFCLLLFLVRARLVSSNVICELPPPNSRSVTKSSERCFARSPAAAVRGTPPRWLRYWAWGKSFIACKRLRDCFRINGLDKSNFTKRRDWLLRPSPALLSVKVHGRQGFILSWGGAGRIVGHLELTLNRHFQ